MESRRYQNLLTFVPNSRIPVTILIFACTILRISLSNQYKMKKMHLDEPNGYAESEI